jgi:hypothetical protein
MFTGSNSSHVSLHTSVQIPACANSSSSMKTAWNHLSNLDRGQRLVCSCVELGGSPIQRTWQQKNIHLEELFSSAVLRWSVLSLITYYVGHYYHLLLITLVSTVTYYAGRYCHLLRWSVLSLITLVISVTYYTGRYCHLLRWSVLSLITLVSTVTHYVGHFCQLLRWSVLSLITLVSTVTYYAGQYCHLLRWSFLSVTTLIITVRTINLTAVVITIYMNGHSCHNGKPHWH